jgi:hypothetical protein
MMSNQTQQGGIAVRWLLAFCGTGAAVMILVQWNSISRLSRDNELLRIAQQESAIRESTSNFAVPSTPPEQLGTEEKELLRLRNEVRLLREQIVLLNTGRREAIQPQVPVLSPPIQSRAEMTELGLAASRGDWAALDKLAELVAVALKGRTNEHQDVAADIRLAFDALGTEAGNGNPTAFQALWKATRMDHLQGLATHALGQAAGMGNEQALEPLLDPERYLLMRSSTVGALKPAADSGNVRAIEALAAVTAEPNQRALWFMVADGLQKAAAAGNTTAIEALVALGRSDNQSVRRRSLQGLENAAFHQHPAAIEALRALGYQ